MSSFNQFTGLGNLTRDPELRFTPKGTAVVEVGIAINRVYSVDGEKREETTFLNVVAFGRTAEIVSEYRKKGDQLLVSGYLKTESWDDKQTGQKRSALKVVAENIVLVGGKRDQSQDEPKAPSQRGTGTYRTQGAKPPPRPPADPDLDAGEDDIPF